MNSKKFFKKKVPWWAFDYPFENEDKGWWKVFYRKIERLRCKRYVDKEYKDSEY